MPRPHADCPCRLLPIALVVVLAGVGTGCTHAEVHRVARYRLHGNAGPVWSLAPASGVYAVRYAMLGELDVRSLEGSQRIVRKGQPLGFRVADDGFLVAVAGAEEIALPLRPDELRKVVWHCRTEDSSQFAREVSKVGQGTVVVGATAGVVVGVGAIGIGNLALQNAIDDARRDQCGEADRHRRHRRRHHHRQDSSGSTAAPSPSSSPGSAKGPGPRPAPPI